MRPVETIILHHSATADSGTVSWPAIRRYHVHTLGWGDIGYHYGVELLTDPGTGLLVPEVLVGRPITMVGAHTRGQNRGSIGVCVVGDYDAEEPRADVWAATAVLVATLCLEHNVAVSAIRGHRDFANKTCPGRKFDLGAFREAVTGLLQEVV